MQGMSLTPTPNFNAELMPYQIYVKGHMYGIDMTNVRKLDNDKFFLSTQKVLYILYYIFTQSKSCIHYTRITFRVLIVFHQLLTSIQTCTVWACICIECTKYSDPVLHVPICSQVGHILCERHYLSLCPHSNKRYLQGCISGTIQRCSCTIHCNEMVKTFNADTHLEAYCIL